MKYKLNFGSEVVVLPRSALKYAKDASRVRLAALLSVAADPAMSAKKRSESLALTEGELAEAISYWLALGVIAEDSPQTQNTEKNGVRRTSETTRAKKERPTALENDAPRLSVPELTDAAREDENARLLEDCQQKMGRVFSAAEADRVVTIRSYLGVTTDFVTLLCDKLKKEGRLNLRTLEKTAIALNDAGIDDTAALVGYFDRREAARSLESKVRSLYGFGRRALTPPERKFIEKWAEYEIGGDLLEYAYELTVKNTGNASMNYTNAIIDAWHSAGIASVDEAKAHEEKFRAKTPSRSRGKRSAEQSASSFDTDNFFEEALRRSFGDEFLETYKNGDAANDESGGDK